jgi:hypothetical protein
MANDSDVDSIGAIGSVDKKKGSEAAGSAHAASQSAPAGQSQPAPQQNEAASKIDTQDKVSISKEAQGLE